MINSLTIEEIYNFLQKDGEKFAALSTINNGHPQAAFVYYTVDEDLNIYFVTRMGSRKYQNILQNNRVAVAVAAQNPAQTVQFEGEASLVTDPKIQEDLFPKLVGLAQSRIDVPPISQFAKTSEIAFIKVSPVWVRWSNFDFGHTKEVVREYTWA